MYNILNYCTLCLFYIVYYIIFNYYMLFNKDDYFVY